MDSGSVAALHPIEVARLNGESFYFTGMPCRKGHICKRVTRNARCFECTLQERRTPKFRARNKAKQKRWRDNNREAALQIERRAARKNLPAATREQSEHCDCCGIHQSLVKRSFSLDHCHEKNTFRGWICNGCNRGIGLLGDGLPGVLAAMRYLVKYGNPEDPYFQIATRMLAVRIDDGQPAFGDLPSTGVRRGYLERRQPRACGSEYCHTQ